MAKKKKKSVSKKSNQTKKLDQNQNINKNEQPKSEVEVKEKEPKEEVKQKEEVKENQEETSKKDSNKKGSKGKNKEAKKEEAKPQEKEPQKQKEINKEKAQNGSKEANKKEGNKKNKKDKKNKKPEEKSKEKGEEKSEDLFKQIEKNKKRNLIVIIVIAVIAAIVMFFSVIFALINVTKSVVIDGVSVKNIDVSGLNLSDTKAKLEETLNIELNAPINIKSNDYEISINSSQIEFAYNISKAAEEAYSVGRKGNIFENNYEILEALMFGKELDATYTYNQEALDSIVNDIESKVPGLVTEASYYREGNELIIIPGTDGVTVNKEKLKNEIINTILFANAADLIANNTKLNVEVPIEDAKAKEIDIDKIYSEVYTEPKDAYYEENPFKIYAEVEGVDFAIDKEIAKTMLKQKQSEYRIPLNITPASKTINDIGLEAFPYLISEFSTKYDASNINRSQNLAIAAGKINGTVLMPGEEFSFNQVVGKRTIEEGYKDAKIYQDGQVVDGLAGGICQISSTLYNTVVKANLEVTERRNHSFTTSYIRAGQDATVVYGVIDFKFKNTRTYPIKISASVNSGIAEFKINGIKEEVEYDISLYPVTTGTIPYSTQYIPDPSLAPGQQVTVQRGASGYKVTTYKDVKLDGKLVSRELYTTDTYSPMKAIVRVGQ